MPSCAGGLAPRRAGFVCRYVRGPYTAAHAGAAAPAVPSPCLWAARGEPGIVRVPAATGLAAGARQFAKENGLEQTGDGMPSTFRSTVLDALALRMLVAQANSIQAAG